MSERGKTIPGIEKLAEVETKARADAALKPLEAYLSNDPFAPIWKAPTSEELSELRKNARIKYMGDVGK